MAGHPNSIDGIASAEKAEDMIAVEVEKTLALVSPLLDLPHTKVWTAYDKEADVLYVNFKRPSHADDSELTDNDVIVRYEKGQVVGVTILNASTRGNN